MKTNIAIFCGIFNLSEFIAIFVFIVIIAAICVMTLVVTIQRFYKNLLSDEGYLMFTLPVHAHSHITSKLLVSMLWNFASVIVSGFAILLIAADPDTMRKLSHFMSEAMESMNKFGASAYVTGAEIIIHILISAVAAIISIYAAMAIGNLSGKHRVLLSLGAYIGFGTVEQIVGSILLLVIPHDWYNAFDNVSDLNYMPAFQAIQLLMLGTIVFTLIFGVAYYILTNYLLKKKLNLE
jgi:hypothetical protein